MQVMDIVTINDMNGRAAIVESVKTYENGMTVYAVRSPYTGVLYGREAEDLTPATIEKKYAVLQDMRHMEPATPELVAVKDYGNAIMTQGMVDAEVRATLATPVSDRVALSSMKIIGLNASTNMFA